MWACYWLGKEIWWWGPKKGLLDALFTSVHKTCLHESQFPEISCKAWTKMIYTQWWKTRLGNVWTNWMHTYLWDQMAWEMARAEQVGQCYCQATLNCLWNTLVIMGGSQGLQESKDHSCTQKGQDRGSRELQASWPHTDPWEGDK